MELRGNWSAPRASVGPLAGPLALAFVNTPPASGSAAATPRPPQAPSAAAPPAAAVPSSTFAAGDPRWVLAQRTAEQLEGSILPVEKRRALLRLSATLGLTLFDANMVLAIVQEQARRGYSPAHCPAAGAEQLALVPLPAPRGKPTISTAARRMGQAALIIAVVIGVEVLLLCWLFR